MLGIISCFARMKIYTNCTVTIFIFVQKTPVIKQGSTSQEINHCNAWHGCSILCNWAKTSACNLAKGKTYFSCDVNEYNDTNY